MKGTLQYYDIEKLGIYKRGSNEQLFDSSEAILDSLIDWFKSRPNLVNTKTKDADKAVGQSNVYCCDAYGKDGEYLFVLWNEMANSDNEILALSKNSKPGEAKVQSGHNSDKNIPGLPSYYWISMNNDFIATIHFDHAVMSLTSFRDYLGSYVSNYSEFAITAKDNHQKVIGYREPNTEGKLGYFKFELKRMVDSSTVEELTQKFTKITKIVRRSKKAVENIDYKGFFKEFGSQAIGRGLPKSRGVCVEIELEFTPKSAADFESIVKKYQEEILEPDKYNNLGFVLKGESGKTMFLDGRQMREEHDFEILRHNKNPFKADELMAYIDRKRIRLTPREVKSRDAA
jgi:hypothetical protein